ncbi:MAG: hypothetical protein QNJ94_14235 [Alphaproteobacteria bacterium]|nr:hypothetical protein [Alphaproteobacteria bacterium]
MSVHRYPMSALSADYLRAAVGLSLTGGPLLLVTGHPVAVWTLGGMAGLFLLFGLRTALRHAMRFALTDQGLMRYGISTFGFANANVPWAKLTKVRLRYYAARRGRSDGWMQLTIKTGGQTLRLESSLEGFEAIAARAAQAAQEQGLQMDSATINNFAAMGIRLDPGDAPDAGSLVQ